MSSVIARADKTMTRRTAWAIQVRAATLLAITVFLIAVLVSMRRGPTRVEWLQVQGTVKNARIVADHAVETKSGSQLMWKAEYNVVYSVLDVEYAFWADSGIRGEDETGVRLLLPKSSPFCRVRYNPQRPAESVADCR